MWGWRRVMWGWQRVMLGWHGVGPPGTGSGSWHQRECCCLGCQTPPLPSLSPLGGHSLSLGEREEQERERRAGERRRERRREARWTGLHVVGERLGEARRWREGDVCR